MKIKKEKTYLVVKLNRIRPNFIYLYIFFFDKLQFIKSKHKANIKGKPPYKLHTKQKVGSPN